MIAEVEDVVALGHVLLALATKDLPDVTHKITSQNTDLAAPACTHRLRYVASRQDIKRILS
jgi:hypothetical protein